MPPPPSLTDSKRLSVLIVVSAGRACAVPLGHVREILRPLPIEPFRTTASFVLGLSVVRGQSIPVVDLALLLGGEGAVSSSARYVTLKLDGRDVVLSVERVVGVRELRAEQLQALPGLVDCGASGLIDALTTHDGELLRVLRTASVLPLEAWAALQAGEVTA